MSMPLSSVAMNNGTDVERSEGEVNVEKGESGCVEKENEDVQLTKNENTSNDDEIEIPETRTRRFPADAKTSKYRGVSLLKNRTIWRARVEYKGKREHLGYFDSEEEAAMAYDQRLLQLFGSRSKFNFPDRIREKFPGYFLPSSSSSTTSFSSSPSESSSVEQAAMQSSNYSDSNNKSSISSSSKSRAKSKKRGRDKVETFSAVGNADAKQDSVNNQAQKHLETPPLMNSVESTQSLLQQLSQPNVSYLGNTLTNLGSINFHQNRLSQMNNNFNILSTLSLPRVDQRILHPHLLNQYFNPLSFSTIGWNIQNPQMNISNNIGIGQGVSSLMGGMIHNRTSDVHQLSSINSQKSKQLSNLSFESQIGNESINEDETSEKKRRKNQKKEQ